MRIVRIAAAYGLLLVLAGGTTAALFAASPADKETYEKLGLSETEWNKIQEMQIPLAKVHQLLESGISISEYYRRPWVQLSIPEPEYIKLRRAGHSDADVRYMFAKNRGESGWTVAGSFFLPGVNQIAKGRAGRGWVMAAVAAGCIAGFAGSSLYTRRFQPLALCLLVPDMLWSGIDMSVRISAERTASPRAETSTAVRMSFSF
jgi:hypothetical protein